MPNAPEREYGAFRYGGEGGICSPFHSGRNENKDFAAAQPIAGNSSPDWQAIGQGCFLESTTPSALPMVSKYALNLIRMVHVG